MYTSMRGSLESVPTPMTLGDLSIGCVLVLGSCCHGVSRYRCLAEHCRDVGIPSSKEATFLRNRRHRHRERYAMATVGDEILNT